MSGDTTDLRSRADALGAATDIARGRIDDAAVERALVIAERVRARLRHGTDRTVVAIVGPTGSGKSTLFNAVVGADISQSGVLRPTTTVAHAALWGGDEPALLAWLEIPRRHLVTDGDPSLDGLVLVDLPDVDSVEVANRAEAERLIEFVDCMVWVVDPQKYADQAVHDRHLAPLRDHSEVLRFALTKTDLLAKHEVDTVVADLESRLRDDGIANPVVWAVSVAEAGAGLEEILAGLRDVVSERRALTLRLDADLKAAAGELGTDAGDQDVAIDTVREEAVEGMGQSVHIDRVAAGVASHHRRLARRTTGWAPVEWLRRRRTSPATELIRSDGVDRVRVEAALRDAAEAGAAGIGPPWDSVVRSELMERTDDVASALRSRSIGVVSRLGSPPRWWSAAAWVQRLLLAVAATGAVWLLAVAVIGATYLNADSFVPRWGDFPIPTLLFLGGVAAGLLLALVCRIPALVGAKRRSRRARRQLEEQVAEVADAQVIAPLRQLLHDRAELGRLIAVVAGDRPPA